MSKDLQIWLLVGCLVTLTGCCGPGRMPRSKLKQTQLSALEAYNRSQMLAGELSQSQQMAGQLAGEKAMAEARAAELERNLSIANERLTNLAQERSRLHDEYKHLLTNLPAPGGNNGPSKAFEELLRRFPQLEYDPISGVSRYTGEILFASGSNQLTPDGQKQLQEFAQIMNSPEAGPFNILIVGHTDDEAVVRPETRARHETNWELSAHRATAVVRQLAKIGVAEPRMGVAGYNKFQPAAPNISDNTKSLNRRVELFVLPPETSIAGRDKSISMK
ncbi:MAG TPA: OmpA family protein [Planctomicrobium sp.]|nr:OmpA family protein [Planctomicrobium sp.]